MQMFSLVMPTSSGKKMLLGIDLTIFYVYHKMPMKHFINILGGS